MKEMQSNYITVDKYKLHYRVAGAASAPPVVLVHGWSASGEMWIETMARLAKSHRCYALDLLGHGDSDNLPDAVYSIDLFAALLKGFCDALGITRAAFVGHSMGGMTVLNFAIKHPDMVERLIPVAAAVTGELPRFIPTLIDLLLHFLRIPIVGELYVRYAPRRIYPVRKLMQLAFLYELPRGDEPYYNLLVDYVVRRDNLRVKLACHAAIRRTNLAPRLSEITAPTLVIVGERDGTVPTDQSRLLAERIPHSRLVVIPRSNHIVMMDQPAAFGDAVREFLV